MDDISEITLESLLHTTIPDKLWHYTDVKGFHGIVTNKKIYATDIRFLNDKEEFHHAETIVKEVCKEVIDKYQSAELVTEFLKDVVWHKFENGVLSFNKCQFFTVSFSEKRDDLSQWRGYSRGSSGVSLGFDLTKLRPASSSTTLVTFAPCVYDDAAKRKLLFDSVSYFAETVSILEKQVEDATTIKSSFDELRKSRPNASIEEIGQELKVISDANIEVKLKKASRVLDIKLFWLAALLKHSSFKDEKEWRLVLPTFTGKMPVHNPVHFRPEKNTLVPYIEFPLPLSSGIPPILPLTEILLGPGSEPVTALAAARNLLIAEGLTTPTDYSSVPFRPW